MQLNIATAPRRDSRHWEQSTVSWNEIITWMLDPAETKESGNYILGTLRETERSHGGQRCTALHRSRQAVVSRDALMLDVDYPEDDFLQHAESLSVSMLIHTTFSSTPERPRYRVIIPLSRPVSPFEYESAATQVMEQLGAGNFDLGSAQPERYMFRPAGEHFDFWVIQGPVMEPPALSPDTAATRGLLPQSKRDPLDLPGVVGAFNRTYTDFDTLCQAYDLPYSPGGGDRWQYQGSESAPGVSEIGEGLWWSNHETDPAGGHAQTAFDMVRIHRFGERDTATDPNTVLTELPSYRRTIELAEADTLVRQEQIEHDFGEASPVKTLGYDTDSLLDDDVARNLSDRGLGERFRYVANRGWLEWTGQRWRDCDALQLWEPMTAAIRSLVEEWFTLGKTTGHINKLKAMLEVPRMKRLIENLRAVLQVDEQLLDAHPDLLTVANGTVDLRTGLLQPHKREDYITSVAPVPYDPQASHPDWTATLQAMRSDVRSWMQLRIGQAATGHRTPDDVLPILQGGGSNGKTTFTGAVFAALGEYAQFLSERAIFAHQSAHPTELMSLKGSRFALLEETPEGTPLNVKRLKDVLGAPYITARRMRQDDETFTSTHSLFMTTNYHPEVTETDEGTWRRLALVQFPFTFKQNAVEADDLPADPHLRSRMETSPTGQHEAVLAWVVAGARRWYEEDRIMPPLPDSVEENMRSWRTASDPLHTYLKERVRADSASAVHVGELYEDFAEWLDREGRTAWSSRLFANRLRHHEGLKALGAQDLRIRPSSEKCEYVLSQRDPLAQAPEGQVRVWAGLRFA